MKGVILAGGKGTRLHPLTVATNKHLLPVGHEPMIFHAMRQMRAAGVREVLVVTSTEHMGDIVRCLGSGAAFDLDLFYRVQEEPLGIAHALSLAEGYAGGAPLCVMLADNVFEHSIAPYARRFREDPTGAGVVLKEVGDPERYGVAALDEQHIVEIEEKPMAPRSSYAVVGLYFYGPDVFDVIRRVRPSARGELEITAVNNAYAAEGRLRWALCQGRWTDAGTFESLREANAILFDTRNRIAEPPAISEGEAFGRA